MKINLIGIDLIKPYDKNPRKNDAAVEKVAASLKEFGFQQPIVVDKDGIIIAGHTRFKAAKFLGLSKVPVLYATGLSVAQVKAYRLADNKTSEFAEWDGELLDLELLDLKEFQFDMAQFGFDSGKSVGEVVEDDFDLEGELENIVEPAAKKGEIWKLGRHRLLCGDSTSILDVDKLMAGEMADLLLTDPPYNVDYEAKEKSLQNFRSNKRVDRNGNTKIDNDKIGDIKFRQFLLEAFTNAKCALKPGAAFYIWHADTQGNNFRNACIDAGLQVRQCIIWVKNNIVIGRQDHQWRHEPCLYGWNEGAVHKWYGGRKQQTVIQDREGVTITKLDADTTQIMLNTGLQRIVFNVKDYEMLDFTDGVGTSVWNVDKPLKSSEHGTMKPIKLCERSIKNSTLEGDLVLDLFGGSGSTLMACEQMGRTCYMMELNPTYIDVIVKRWEEFTKQKAELI